MLRSSVPLFVYGSLKRGFRHHGLLRGVVRLGEATLPNCRLVLLEEYPALVSSPSGVVHGELYRVDRGLLAALDRFEDCPTLYRRRLVLTTQGRVAFAYFASSADAGEWEALPGSRFSE